MSDTSTHEGEHQVHIKSYLMVFAALGVLTVVTVAASYLDVSTTVGIIIGLLIATVKGTLVACYFMHLISEKKTILMTLILTAIFFVVLMMAPISSYLDRVL